MNILIIGGKSNAESIKRSAEKRGHFVDIVSSRDLVIYVNNGKIKYMLPTKELLLRDYDLIFPYVLSTRIWHWIMYLKHVHKKYPHIKFIYSKYIDSKYKLYLSSVWDMKKLISKDINVPKTAVVHDAYGLKKALPKFEFPVIIKIRQSGMVQRGTGVFLVDSTKQALKLIKTYPHAASYLIREYIPNDGDYRLFTINYKVIAVMKRIPKKGEFRSNISQGGTGIKIDLDSVPELIEIAQKAAKITKNDIAGVDIMINKETGVPYVLEVNRGPQFAGVSKATGVNIARHIVKYMELLVNRA